MFFKKKHARDLEAEKVKYSLSADKKVQEEAFKEVKERNEKLNQVLVGNGFTVQIFSAMGGKLKHRKGNL